VHESGSAPSMTEDQQDSQFFNCDITGTHPALLLPYRPTVFPSDIGPHDLNHISTHSVAADNAKPGLSPMGGLDELMRFAAIPLNPVLAVPSDRAHYASIPLISGDVRVESQHTSPPFPMAGHNIHRFPPPHHHHHHNVPIEFSPAERLPRPLFPRSFDSHIHTHFGVQCYVQSLEKWPDSYDRGSIRFDGSHSRGLKSEHPRRLERYNVPE